MTTATATCALPTGYRLAVTDLDYLNLPDACPLCGKNRVRNYGAYEGYGDYSEWDDCGCPLVVEDASVGGWTFDVYDLDSDLMAA